MKPKHSPPVAWQSTPQESARRRLETLDDAALVRLTLENEPQAFEVLLARYTPMVMGTLYGRTRDECDAEDLTQEIFLTAYRGLARLRSPRRFGPWLLRILRTRLIDYYRHKGRRPHLILSDGNANDVRGPVDFVADTRPGPDRAMQGGQVRSAVLDCIGELDELYRTVIYLRLIREVSNVEIARLLRLKECTVRTRLFRGLELLRKGLRRRGIGPEEGG